MNRLNTVTQAVIALRHYIHTDYIHCQQTSITTSSSGTILNVRSVTWISGTWRHRYDSSGWTLYRTTIHKLDVRSLLQFYLLTSRNMLYGERHAGLLVTVILFEPTAISTNSRTGLDTWVSWHSRSICSLTVPLSRKYKVDTADVNKPNLCNRSILSLYISQGQGSLLQSLVYILLRAVLNRGVASRRRASTHVDARRAAYHEYTMRLINVVVM